MGYLSDSAGYSRCPRCKNWRRFPDLRTEEPVHECVGPPDRVLDDGVQVWEFESGDIFPMTGERLTGPGSIYKMPDFEQREPRLLLWPVVLFGLLLLLFVLVS